VFGTTFAALIASVFRAICVFRHAIEADCFRPLQFS
jgi:hypothetical protein